MNKTIEDLKNELDNLYNRDKETYLEFAKQNEDCGNYNCSHYEIMIHKNIKYYLCNDTYSGKYCCGWHPIYCETLDLCSNYRNK